MLKALTTLIAVALCSLAYAVNSQATDSATTVFTFGGTIDGQLPSGGVIQGVDGYFYGTTQTGGTANAGTIFRSAPAGATTVLYNFTGGADGAHPMASLTQGTDGNLYGTTSEGGNGDGHGTVFKITPAGVFTLLYTFTGSFYDGGNPMAGLVQGTDGNFYGTTYGVGYQYVAVAHGVGNNYVALTDGTVFKITPAGVLTTLHAFTGGAAGGYTGDGASPDAGLTLGKDGNFYGTTYQGGAGNYYGTVFKITPAGVLTTLYSFTGAADGGNPETGLTLGEDGNFYGTAYLGGNGGYGTVFKITPAGAFKLLYSFTDGADGANPDAGLTLGGDKNFYGTTSSGPGTIFQITPAGILTTKHTFTDDGPSRPNGALALGKDGYLYGATEYGGATNADGTFAEGTFYKVTLAGVLTPLYGFIPNIYDGVYTYGGVIFQSKDGNFYGTTDSGGLHGDGTVYKLTPAGLLTTLYSFTNGADGAFPEGGLTQGTDGNFYGTTAGTGQAGDVAANGTVFQITPTGVLKTLYTFPYDAADGTYPDGQYLVTGLTQGKDGNFYGTAEFGGDANNGGTVFKITPAGVFTRLYTFSVNPADGSYDAGHFPRGGLTQGKDGNFYGTTGAGGATSGGYSGQGTVFQITPAGVLTTLHTFAYDAATSTYPDGYFPDAGLTLGTDGNFYGTTESGGDDNNGGTVFKITPAGVFTHLFTFSYDPADGSYDAGHIPESGLTLGSNGNFYGTTTEGGFENNDGSGTIFEITPAGALTTLFEFPAYQPLGGSRFNLTQGSDGNLYGVVENTVYRFNMVKPVVTSATAIGQIYQIFSWQVASTNGPSTFAAINLPSGLSINTASGLISGIPTQTGTFAVGLSVTNSVGTSTAMLGLTIYSPPPVITSALSAAGQVAHLFSYQITAANSPTSFAASGLPAGLSINTASGLISGKPDASGTFTVVISAANARGTGTAKLVLTVKPAIPEINSVLTANGHEGQAFSYQITARYAPTSFGATSLPAGLSVNTATGLISGTPAASGTFSAGLSATNAAGTGTATLTLTINPPSPVITSALSAAGQVAHLFSYQITAANSPTSFAASGLPAGLSINTTSGLISGKPDASGTFTVVISAANAGGTGTAKLVLTVKPAIPEISSVLTANGQVGQAFSYQITARYTPTTFAATGLPAGLSVNTATGLISGAPTATGKFSVGLSATNVAGTGKATLTLTISCE